MKKVVKYIFIIAAAIFLIYLALPAPNFPEPLKDVYISKEPADIETILRRGYYTDYAREDVLAHYVQQFSKSMGFIYYPTYRLNYPPEEAQTRIRDQARSSYLEEIVHPFRESIYVNGLEPKLDKDMIVIKGKHWAAKVIVRYIPSNVFVRVITGILTLLIIYLVYKEWEISLRDFKKYIKAIK